MKQNNETFGLKHCKDLKKWGMPQNGECGWTEFDGRIITVNYNVTADYAWNCTIICDDPSLESMMEFAATLGYGWEIAPVVTLKYDKLGEIDISKNDKGTPASHYWSINQYSRGTIKDSFDPRLAMYYLIKALMEEND